MSRSVNLFLATGLVVLLVHGGLHAQQSRGVLFAGIAVNPSGISTRVVEQKHTPWGPVYRIKETKEARLALDGDRKMLPFQIHDVCDEIEAMIGWVQRRGVEKSRILLAVASGMEGIPNRAELVRSLENRHRLPVESITATQELAFLSYCTIPRANH